MGITTAERNDTAVAAAGATFPFEFFSSKRWTVQGLIALVADVYTEYEEDRLPPSLGMIIHSLDCVEVYATEVIWRAYLEGGVAGPFGEDVQEHIQNAIAEGAVADVDDYVRMMYEDFNGEVFNIDPSDKNGWGIHFLNDVEALLNLAGLFYIQVEYDNPDEYEFHTTGSLPNTRQLELHNCPIVEVW